MSRLIGKLLKITGRRNCHIYRKKCLQWLFRFFDQEKTEIGLLTPNFCISANVLLLRRCFVLNWSFHGLVGNIIGRENLKRYFGSIFSSKMEIVVPQLTFSHYDAQ